MKKLRKKTIFRFKRENSTSLTIKDGKSDPTTSTVTAITTFSTVSNVY